MKTALFNFLAKKAGFKWKPQEKLWSREKVAGVSLGSAGAMTILGQVFGISAVAHSSGAMILTGSAGYISGTFIAGTLVWLIWPLLIVVGLGALFWKRVVAAFDWAIERIYFWRNAK
ncbi:hypothetical protein KO498_06585 [Lentibacter algarum]|uniref:hypothetical protein n=1 Tax=Lentibacter algarum TaxID=576131 RepID=UPI001C072711|nr:hypothetical protein [Lentibacter algarum]MBU2981479.1 hypothetical protein [Lentibacter algarum]